MIDTNHLTNIVCFGLLAYTTGKKNVYYKMPNSIGIWKSNLVYFTLFSFCGALVLNLPFVNEHLLICQPFHFYQNWPIYFFNVYDFSSVSQTLLIDSNEIGTGKKLRKKNLHRYIFLTPELPHWVCEKHVAEKVLTALHEQSNGSKCLLFPV